MVKNMALAGFGIVVFLATSSAEEPRFEVQNKGDSVEIRAVEGRNAQIPEASAPVVILATDTLRSVVSRYGSAVRKAEKEACLDWISRTPPRTLSDAQALLHLFDRNDPHAASAVHASLLRLSPADQTLAPFFLGLLKDSEPGFQLFGLAGARQMRPPAMLEPLREIASRPFTQARPSLATGPAQALQWKVQLEALKTLCDWPGDDGRENLQDLLLKRAKEAPPVAGLLAQHFWNDTLPRIVRWSESKDPGDQERASAAWAASVPTARLQASWDRLWSLLRDRGKRFETRHQAALKLGLASDETKVSVILKARQESADPKEKLLLTAALFASRSPQAIPALVEYVKTDPVPTSRAGALIQLKDMMPKEELRELLRWTAANDPDAENRALAQRELKSK